MEMEQIRFSEKSSRDREASHNLDRDGLIAFIRELIERRGISANRLATHLGLSRTTVSRWLSGKDVPSPASCHRIAEYSGIPSTRILSLAGHLVPQPDSGPVHLPEFREYVTKKYPGEMDEDLIAMVEVVLERRRERGN